MMNTLKRCLNHWTIHRSVIARLILTVIPASCPFARTIRLGNWTIVRIPPMCKLNPLYEELMALRFRALCYLEMDQTFLP